MHICMVCSAQIPPVEGVGFNAWNLAKHLYKKGHQVQVVTRGNATQPKHEVIEDIPVWRPLFLPLYPFHVHFHGIFVNRLVKQLEKEVDVFNVHMPLSPVIKTKRPIILTMQTPRLSDTQVIKVRDWLSLLVRLQLPISIMIEKKLISRSKKVTAVSRSVVKELAPYGLDEEAVVILRNGADAEVFRPSERNGREQPYILSVGRLGLRKGYEDLIQCAKMVVSRYPELQFKIAGKGPFENRLREQITNEGLQENVILLGHITDREELVRLFQGATVFLHPAHYEGLPTVLLEAMACGCACVSTAVSGALDVIVSGENGVLVPPYTPDEMAKAVIQLYEDPPLCNELGMAARKTIEAGYSWEKVGADYAALFEQVIKEG